VRPERAKKPAASAVYEIQTADAEKRELKELRELRRACAPLYNPAKVFHRL